MIIVPLKKLSLALLSATDVLRTKKFGSEHLLRIERQIKKEVWRTLCKLVKKCLKALVFLMHPNQLNTVSLEGLENAENQRFALYLKDIHKKKRMHELGKE